MADNIDITPGTGKTVATDDTGANGHVQLFKLAISSNGLATLIPADAANGLDVDVTRVQGTVNVDAGTVTLAEPVTVDGTVAVTEPVSVDDNAGSLTVDAPVGTPLFAKLSDGASAIGDALARPLFTKLTDGASALGDALARPLFVKLTDGAAAIGIGAAAPLHAKLSDGTTAIGSTSQRLHVQIAGGDLPAGNNNIGDVDVASIAAGTNNIGQTDPRGNVAHDGADSGNPVKVGGRARTSLVAAVANDDRVDFTTDKHARQLTANYLFDNRTNGKGTFTNSTAADIIAAAGASTVIVATNILVVNGHATVDTKVEIRDGTTVKIQGYAAADGGGFQMNHPQGILASTANTALTARAVTTGADVDVFISGYTMPG